MQKARRHTVKDIVLRPLVGKWFQVLFHSPNRGTFHHSLALLLRYRSIGVLSLGGWAPQIHTGFHVAGATRENIERALSFAYRAITLYRQSFQTCSARRGLCNSLGDCNTP